jgi:hypothetical protein
MVPNFRRSFKRSSGSSSWDQSTKFSMGNAHILGWTGDGIGSATRALPFIYLGVVLILSSLLTEHRPGRFSKGSGEYGFEVSLGLTRQWSGTTYTGRSRRYRRALSPGHLRRPENSPCDLCIIASLVVRLFFFDKGRFIITHV